MPNMQIKYPGSTNRSECYAENALGNPEDRLMYLRIRHPQGFGWADWSRDWHRQRQWLATNTGDASLMLTPLS